MSLKQTLNKWQSTPLNQARRQPKRRTLPDEESFFNALIDYYHGQNYASVYINLRKTHGRRDPVSYTPIPPYYNVPGWGTNVNKEISDVFFVVFSPKRRLARMTHLQAKYEKKKGFMSQTNNFVFQLDDGQYLMMHNRLPLTKAGLFPQDIFSFPLFSDSIASYGVFYQEFNGDINMAYEVAPLISYPGTTPYASKRAKDDHSFATTKDLWGYTNIYLQKAKKFFAPFPYCCDLCCGECGCSPELLSTLSVDTFEDELLRLHVGTRVDFDIRTLQQIAQLFKGNKAFNDFINDLAQRLERRGWVELVESFRREQNGDEPPRGDERPINIEEIGGAYILINADQIERRE